MFLVVITLLKGKVWTALLGIMIPFFVFVGAIRLARPRSVWSRWRYEARPKRMARASAERTGGTARMDRFRIHTMDLIAGAPTKAPSSWPTAGDDPCHFLTPEDVVTRDAATPCRSGRRCRRCLRRARRRRPDALAAGELGELGATLLGLGVDVAVGGLERRARRGAGRGRRGVRRRASTHRRPGFAAEERGAVPRLVADDVGQRTPRGGLDDGHEPPSTDERRRPPLPPWPAMESVDLGSRAGATRRYGVARDG